MKRTAKNLIAIARAEIGYHEKASNSNLDSKIANSGHNNYQKYGRDLAKAGYYNGNKNGYAWCDQFVDWNFWTLCDHNKAEAEKMTCQTGPYGAGVEYSAQYYKAQGRLDSHPRVGDQAFFGKREHTGIVSAVNGNRVTVIEGNKNDCVSENTYTIGQWLSNEFGHPYYEEDTEAGWFKDSKGWYYLDDNGNKRTSAWIEDTVDWCYVDADGYMLTNAWVEDSHGWCFVKDDGRILRDGYANDSQGKHYVDSTGHMVK